MSNFKFYADAEAAVRFNAAHNEVAYRPDTTFNHERDTAVRQALGSHTTLPWINVKLAAPTPTPMR